MSASRFYAALTALLFLAVSAWAGAALFGRIPAPQEAEESSPPQPGGSLRGIVLRQEQVFPSGEAPAVAEDGKRLSARETGRGSGLYFDSADGWEFLTPADAEALSPEKLDRLLETAPRAAGGARLVTGRAFFYAAFLEGDAPPEAGATYTAPRPSVSTTRQDRPAMAKVAPTSGALSMLPISRSPQITRQPPPSANTDRNR